MKLKRIVTQTEEKSEIYNRTCAIRSQRVFATFKFYVYIHSPGHKL